MDAEGQAPIAPSADDPRGERRLLPTLAVVVIIALPFLLPHHVHVEARWLLASAEVVLLVALAIADPGRIDRRGALIRGLAIALTLVLLVTVALASAHLVLELVRGAPRFQDAKTLLATAAIVWIDLSLTFSLLYWELDSGGPAGRLHGVRAYPDFAFVQHVNPELAPPGWRPTYVDYAYLALTNSIAFSPTDVMPLTRWAKGAMAIQSIVSFALLGLAVANAVNLLN